ncbi:MAG TPA: DUF4912 domain-containing protein [Chthoniobacterales bacterium]
MNDSETSAQSDPQSVEGFRISDEPVVRSRGASAMGNGAVPSSHDTDLLYVIARDPKSLFVYWDLNWTRIFSHAGIAARQVYLRIYCQDGSVEGTREINPFLGHCYADVAAAGADYHCELGCLEGDEWISLVRSGKAATPADHMSDDLSAQFATLPLHLNFQRMLDILRTTKTEDATLARTVASLQESARATPDAVEPRKSANGPAAADFRALAQAIETAAPTPEERARWAKLSEELDGSSWGGASESGLGGSSPA